MYAWGGVVGLSSGLSEDCYNTGTVNLGYDLKHDYIDVHKNSDWFYVGGITGLSEDRKGGGTYSQGSSVSCYNVGELYNAAPASSMSVIGGVCGSSNRMFPEFDPSITVINSYCLDLHDSELGVQFSPEQMKTASHYVGFDFGNIWNISPSVNNGYPFLRPFTDSSSPEKPSEPQPSKFDTVIPGRLIKAINTSDRSRTYPVVWDDTLLDNDSDVYNHDLAKLSILLSHAAYANDSDAPRKYIQQAWSNLKFNDFYTTNYANSKNTAAFSLAHKTIVSNATEYDLLVIVIRGTPNNDEWYGNFDIGTGSTHSNFSAAKDNILGYVKDYMPKLDNQLDKKILITGHSRGAAIANLLAKDLADGVVSIASPENIYTYTFATPTVSTQTKTTYPQKPYNIFNLLHYDDFVPQLPLGAWGFGRYGSSYPFPSALTNKMKTEFSKITMGMKFNDFNNSMAISSFTDDIYDAANTVTQFYNLKHGYGLSKYTTAEYFEEVCNVLIELFSFKGGSSISRLGINALQIPRSKLSPISSFLIANEGQLTHSHTSETYIAWLDSLDDDWIIKAYPAYKKTLRIECPVDVYVYDEEGRLVGTVIDNDIDTMFENPIGISLVNGDEKELSLSPHRDFTIELIATGSGTMSYSAADTNAESHNLITQEAHSNVALEDGKRFVGLLSASSFIEISSTTQFNSLLYTEADGTLEIVAADGSQTAINKASVLAYSMGGGGVGGGGIYDVGSNITLYASPDGNHRFTGWYNGTQLVNTGTNYSFVADSNIKLEARFASITNYDDNGNGSSSSDNTDDTSLNMSAKMNTRRCAN